MKLFNSLCLATIFAVGCAPPPNPGDAYVAAHPEMELIESTGQALFSGLNIEKTCNDLPASGCPNAAPTSGSSDRVQECLNRYRKFTGLSCVPYHAPSKTAAQNHAFYVARYLANGLGVGCLPGIGHDEVSSCTGFTGVGPGDRVAAASIFPIAGFPVTEVGTLADLWFSSDITVDESTRNWSYSVYHSTPQKSSILAQSGGATGSWQHAPGHRTSTVFREDLNPIGEFRAASLWPPPEAHDWSVGWDGNEQPFPPGVSAGSSGPVISVIRDDFSPSMLGVDWSLWEFKSTGSLQVPVQRFDYHNDPNLVKGEYFMIPNARLKPGQCYIASVTGNVWTTPSGGKCRPFTSGCNSHIETHQWAFYTSPVST
jgi:hypothetical protein